MAAARFFIPNVQEFFNDLLRLLQQCHHCLQENVDGGTAEFLGRRLEEYQRTLRVMYGRVRESRQYSARLIQDIEQLLHIIDRKLEALEALYRYNNFRGGANQISLSSEEDVPLCTPVRSGNAGRPRYEVTQEQILGLRDSLGFRWVDIANILGLSVRTLNRRRQ